MHLRDKIRLKDEDPQVRSLAAHSLALLAGNLVGKASSLDSLPLVRSTNRVQDALSRLVSLQKAGVTAIPSLADDIARLRKAGQSLRQEQHKRLGRSTISMDDGIVPGATAC